MQLNKVIFLVPSIICSFTIFILSHQPNMQLDYTGFVFEDKLWHFIAYACLGSSIFYAVSNISKKNISRLILNSLIICSIFALSDEIHQYFIPGRMFELSDIIADIFGALTAIIVYSLIYKWKNARTMENV